VLISSKKNTENHSSIVNEEGRENLDTRLIFSKKLLHA